jgi:hypothetical protein
MGWTHHWQREAELPAKPFEDAVADCRKLFELLKAPLADSKGYGQPEFTNDKIAFNGANGCVCEPFIINRIQQMHLGKNIVLGCCKTEHLPYDLCVQCTLIILKHHFGDAIKVTSDVTDSGWDEAKKACTEYLGYGNNFCLAEKPQVM